MLLQRPIFKLHISEKQWTHGLCISSDVQVQLSWASAWKASLYLPITCSQLGLTHRKQPLEAENRKQEAGNREKRDGQNLFP